MSDIHLEFDYKADDFCNALKGGREGHTEDVLVLPGDVTVKNKTRWLTLISPVFKHIIYVLGNHEFYHQNLDNTYRKTKEGLPDNVHLLQNESVTLDGVTFHGTTLWTDIDKGNPLSYMTANQSMNDFRLIRADGGHSRFTPQRSHTEHNVAKLFLRDNVKEGDVVVTHHAPSFQSIHEKYKGSNLNGCYASDLSDLILDIKPSLWFHGHLHDTVDYMIGDTRILCNPRGYVDIELNDEFEEMKYVEI